MADKIIFADDGAFFAKTLDAPESLSDADLRGFVETWVETNSPMPAERMRTGFLRVGGRVHVFSGLDERVFAGLDGAEAESPVVAPASLLPLCGVSDGFALVRSPRCVSIAEFSDGAIVSLCSRKNSGDAPADIAALRAESGSAGGGRMFAVSDGLVSEFDGEGSLLSGAAVPKAVFRIPEKALATLDVRDAEIVRAFAKKRRAERLKSACLRLVPLAFALLLLGQIVLWFGERGVSRMAAEFAEIEPQAKEIESRAERLAELRRFSRKKLRAVESLALLNADRPEKVRFLRYTQTSPNSVEIRGYAATIGETNAYLDALKKNPAVASAELKSETSRGEAKFVLGVVLK